MFRKIDCLRLPVPDLDAALEFYRDALGHELKWRTPTAAGLRMPDDDAEIVLHTEGHPSETDMLVASAEEAVHAIVAAGGTVVQPPFDIAIGRCAVVRDPFGNILVLLDMTKGPLRTDAAGNVVED
jgi:predicted enzyme related to lactoylglutathione lyase